MTGIYSETRITVNVLLGENIAFLLLVLVYTITSRHRGLLNRVLKGICEGADAQHFNCVIVPHIKQGLRDGRKTNYTPIGDH